MPSRLVGTWHLVSWVHRLPDGKTFEPLGAGAKGLLVYTKDGYMTAQLMAAGRKLFRSTGLFSGSEAERAAAAGTYLAYCGPYRVEKDRVFHSVEMSLFPNWVGTEQERLFRLDGDRLTLSTPPFFSKGKGPQTAELVWKRIGAA